MLVASAAVLTISLVAVLIGGEARALALAPWGLLAALTVVDLLLSISRRKSVSFDMPAEIFVGESVPLTLKLPNGPIGLKGRIEWPEGLSGETDLVFKVDDEGKMVAQVDCNAVRRGIWKCERLWLYWPSRLGFFEFVPHIPFDLEARVVPNIRLVQSGEITTTVESTLYGVKENRTIGEGTEFHQLRDFVQGMDIKSIDWKRSARHRNLVARELRAERNHHVIVALDNGYLMREEIAGLPKIDHAVTAALATAWAATIGGDLVGYYAYDVRPRAFSAPMEGRKAFANMRSWTAELAYESQESNHTLALTELNSRTPKRSLIIVFTDFVDTTSAELLVENISVLAARHLLIFVTIRDPDVEELIETRPSDLNDVSRVVAANQSISERRLVLERLARMGVTIIDAQPNTVTAQLVSAYIDIKAREMI